ncbi:terminase small subunit [Ottowia sp. GY511]|uniref:Terminase small subunit n=1 Tax=Ottowia flava TaxID=2675430 RepID=A0ABW4KRJ3_9BURK|nr:terminase small subunit [Ottowia sp. GY511]TXK26510.1 terminase small subunit [Ottowia sp. GY511]
MALKITETHVFELNAPPSALDVAILVGVTRQAIANMLSDNRLGSPKTNGELLLAYCARLRETASNRGQVIRSDGDGDLNPQQEKAQLDRSRREAQEIKNAVARGEFAPIELLTNTLASASVAVADQFDQLPNMVRKSCPDMRPGEVETVQRVINNARNAWVRGTAALVSESLDEDMGQDEGEGDDASV